MKIMLPCDQGECLVTLKGIKILSGVSWFKWSDGTEFTYFFEENKKWSTPYFFSEKDPDYNLYYEVCDTLLLNDFLKTRGLPIKGRGFVCGLRLFNNRLFTEIILTDSYFAHIYTECDKRGNYIKGGDILVPPSWDTEQKKYSIIMKHHNDVDVSCIM